MRKLSIIFYFLISNCLAQNIDFSIIGNWQEIEYQGNNGATDYINKIENGRVFIFETNNIIKDTKGNIGTYQLNELKLHISLLNDERFYKIYYEKNNNQRLSLIPVTNKYEYICDEGCSEIFQKLDNVLEIKNRTVYGIVKDSLGFLPEAKINIEGTTRGTITDIDGKYSIKANSNEFLIFSYLGKKNHRIIADKFEINVELESDGRLSKDVLPYEPPKPRKNENWVTSIVRVKDLKYVGTPKYDFQKSAKNNVFIIFISKLTIYDFNKEDLEFQKKYNIKYSLIGDHKIDYLTKYNKLTFKYLKNKYKKIWLTEIRKDAVGLH
jgi:CarboxypepD_reg-like domain